MRGGNGIKGQITIDKEGGTQSKAFKSSTQAYAFLFLVAEHQRGALIPQIVEQRNTQRLIRALTKSVDLDRLRLFLLEFLLGSPKQIGIFRVGTDSIGQQSHALTPFL
jgi:hypothetical protein